MWTLPSFDFFSSPLQEEWDGGTARTCRYAPPPPAFPVAAFIAVSILTAIVEGGISPTPLLLALACAVVTPLLPYVREGSLSLYDLPGMATRTLWPKVCFMIPATSSDSTALLETTLNSLVSVDYPMSKLFVCLCDDGNRAEVEDIARGATYPFPVSYTSLDVKKNGVAGMINTAMVDEEDGEAEFIMVVSPGTVVHKDALPQALPYFYTANGSVTDPSDVAAVQVEVASPPSASSVLAGLEVAQRALWSSCKSTSIRALPLVDKLGYVGTTGNGSVFRSSALLDIGGLQYGAPAGCEIPFTSHVLHSHGWKGRTTTRCLLDARGVETFTAACNSLVSSVRSIAFLITTRTWHTLRSPIPLRARLLHFVWPGGVHLNATGMLAVYAPLLAACTTSAVLQYLAFAVALIDFHAIVSAMAMLPVGCLRAMKVPHAMPIAVVLLLFAFWLCAFTSLLSIYRIYLLAAAAIVAEVALRDGYAKYVRPVVDTRADYEEL